MVVRLLGDKLCPIDITTTLNPNALKAAVSLVTDFQAAVVQLQSTLPNMKRMCWSSHEIPVKRLVGVSQIRGTFLGVPYNKDHSIWGSNLGSASLEIL